MRLKTFSAPTMNEALREVREALGEDAIIVKVRSGRYRSVDFTD